MQCLVAGVLWTEYNPATDECTNEKCEKAFGMGYNRPYTFFAQTTITLGTLTFRHNAFLLFV
jgi:hypothetical protein